MMDIYKGKQQLTAYQELQILDKRIAQMKQAYVETKDNYYLIMLKALAKKQEQLSVKVRFAEV